MTRRLRVAPRLVALVALLATAVGVTASPPTASAAPAPAKDPVILISGFASSAIAAWPMQVRLQAAGFDAYTWGLPDDGTTDYVAAAEDLGTFVDSVLASTGASKVDLVGHSAGGLVARQYVRFAGGNGKVDSLVTVATPNHGTNRANLASLLGGDCLGIVPCQQMAIGSSFLAALNAGDETYGSARYTTFRSLWDEVVVPIDSAKLADGADNVLLQSPCLFRYAEHALMAIDGAVADGVMDALRREPVRMNCWAA